jgi:hypothetical protein
MGGERKPMGVAMLVPTKTKGAVRLRFDGGIVYIIPSDSKRFRMTAKRAVETLQARAEIDKMVRKFSEEYLPLLHAWCEEHASQINSCFLWVPTHHGLTVLVVGSSAKYDFKLGEAISEFAGRLEDHGWPSNILQIVAVEPEDLLAYFDPESSLQVYAQAETAPGKG